MLVASSLAASGVPHSLQAHSMCEHEFAVSKDTYDRAAGLVGNGQQKIQDVWESELMHREAAGVCLEEKCMVYFIQPKSAHSTIHNHLMKEGGSWTDGVAFDAWDAKHSGMTLNEPIHELGEKKDLAALFAISKDAPLGWTVVREPLGHFIAGFDQVEFNTPQAGSLVAEGKAEGSEWMASKAAGAPVLERANAMLSDLLAHRGPEEYVHTLVHVAPQSLGMKRLGADKPGVIQLDAVGTMEDLAEAWQTIQGKLGVKEPTAVETHINGNGSRRGEAEGDLRKELEHGLSRLHAERAERRKAAVAGANVLAAEAAHDELLSAYNRTANHTFAELASFVTQVQSGRGVELLEHASEVDMSFREALCLVLSREYACLSSTYTAPKACAAVLKTQRETLRKSAVADAPKVLAAR